MVLGRVDWRTSQLRSSTGGSAILPQNICYYILLLTAPISIRSKTTNATTYDKGIKRKQKNKNFPNTREIYLNIVAALLLLINQLKEGDGHGRI